MTNNPAPSGFGYLGLSAVSWVNQFHSCGCGSWVFRRASGRASTRKDAWSSRWTSDYLISFACLGGESTKCMTRMSQGNSKCSDRSAFLSELLIHGRIFGFAGLVDWSDLPLRGLFAFRVDATMTYLPTSAQIPKDRDWALLEAVHDQRLLEGDGKRSSIWLGSSFHIILLSWRGGGGGGKLLQFLIPLAFGTVFYFWMTGLLM